MSKLDVFRKRVQAGLKKRAGMEDGLREAFDRAGKGLRQRWEAGLGMELLDAEWQAILNELEWLGGDGVRVCQMEYETYRSIPAARVEPRTLAGIAIRCGLDGYGLIYADGASRYSKRASKEHKTSVKPSPASGPGALDGFDIICEDCGFVGGYSIESLAKEYAREHTEYGKKYLAKQAEKEWTPETAWALIGNQPDWAIKNMIKALESDVSRFLNTPADEERLSAAKWIIKNKVKNPRYSTKKVAMPAWVLNESMWTDVSYLLTDEFEYEDGFYIYTVRSIEEILDDDYKGGYLWEIDEKGTGKRVAQGEAPTFEDARRQMHRVLPVTQGQIPMFANRKQAISKEDAVSAVETYLATQGGAGAPWVNAINDARRGGNSGGVKGWFQDRVGQSVDLLQISVRDDGTLYNAWQPGPRVVEEVRGGSVIQGGSRRDFSGVHVVATSPTSFVGWDTDMNTVIVYKTASRKQGNYPNIIDLNQHGQYLDDCSECGKAITTRDQYESWSDANGDPWVKHVTCSTKTAKNPQSGHAESDLEYPELGEEHDGDEMWPWEIDEKASKIAYDVACRACGGHGEYYVSSFGVGGPYDDLVTCETCGGSGIVDHHSIDPEIRKWESKDRGKNVWAQSYGDIDKVAAKRFQVGDKVIPKNERGMVGTIIRDDLSSVYDYEIEMRDGRIGIFMDWDLEPASDEYIAWESTIDNVFTPSPGGWMPEHLRASKQATIDLTGLPQGWYRLQDGTDSWIGPFTHEQMRYMEDNALDAGEIDGFVWGFSHGVGVQRLYKRSLNEQSGHAESDLDDVEVTDDHADEEPMWPWEIESRKARKDEEESDFYDHDAIAAGGGDRIPLHCQVCGDPVAIGVDFSGWQRPYHKSNGRWGSKTAFHKSCDFCDWEGTFQEYQKHIFSGIHDDVLPPASEEAIEVFKEYYRGSKTALPGEDSWDEFYDALPGEMAWKRYAGNGEGGAGIWVTEDDRYEWEAWSDSGATISQGVESDRYEAMDKADAALTGYYGITATKTAVGNPYFQPGQWVQVRDGIRPPFQAQIIEEEWSNSSGEALYRVRTDIGEEIANQRWLLQDFPATWASKTAQDDDEEDGEPLELEEPEDDDDSDDAVDTDESEIEEVEESSDAPEGEDEDKTARFRVKVQANIGRK